jgi:hypothetical protein
VPFWFCRVVVGVVTCGQRWFGVRTRPGSRKSGAQVLAKRGFNFDMHNRLAESDSHLFNCPQHAAVPEGQRVWVSGCLATFMYYRPLRPQRSATRKNAPP